MSIDGSRTQIGIRHEDCLIKYDPNPSATIQKISDNSDGIEPPLSVVHAYDEFSRHIDIWKGDLAPEIANCCPYSGPMIPRFEVH